MSKNLIISIFLIILVFQGVATANLSNSNIGKKVQEDDLISREILFGNPDRIAVSISNDGKYISFLAPKDGVLNVWIADITDPINAVAVTTEKSRSIRSYFWAKDNKHIIYAQDKKGDENWRLYSTNIETLEERDLTPTDGVRASVLKLSNKFPSKMLVLLNDRVPEYFDIYQVDILTGESELLYENNSKYSSFIADDNFNIRGGYKMLPSGEGEFYLFKNNDISKPTLFQKIAVEDMLTTAPLHISHDGDKLFMIDSSSRNTSALVEIDLNDFSRRLIHSDPRADIDDYLTDTKTKMIQGASVNYTTTEWTIFDQSIKSDLEYLKTVDSGVVNIVSRTYEDNEWIITFIKSDSPHRYYLYDRSSKEAKFLFTSDSKKESLPFSKMHPVIIKSRDGLDLISYLTVPRWLDDGSGNPSSPVPMVLNVHGGPNARDSWGFNAQAQWLANRGYATLSVNYRGSTGFGKGFINAGDGQWARKMQDDLADAVTWAIDKHITTKDQVAIMGGSYGGYATLVGMSMTPDMYVAGVDIVGPSNLETLLNSIPPYWKPHMAHLVKMLGASPDTQEGRAFLKERSPITYANKIKKPLLVVQGANDPRVKQAESDQIVSAMKKHAVPVVYLLYSDEGHGLVSAENRLSMYAHIETFLANFAKGRVIPHNNDFPNSSIEIKEGKEINWTKSQR